MTNELLNYYQNYLTADKKVGKATVKNYLADIRRFTNWYENTYKQTFHPKAVTKVTVDAYLSGNSQPGSLPSLSSASSLKRYGSSLRKFYAFLIEKQLADTNPFAIEPIVPAFSTDPWHTKEFKNYLFLSDVSKVTLKNYLIDVKQFTQWADEVLKGAEMPQKASVLQMVTSSSVEEYKKRLLHEARLSPVSINRKLSSLRKYFAWAQEQGFLADEVAISSEAPVVVPIQAPMQQIQIPQPTPALTLEDLKNEPEIEVQPESKSYSSFAPVRLMQKTSGIITLGVGLLILKPIDKTAEAIKYSYWKASGRKVFASVEEIVGVAAPIVASEAVNQLQAASPVNRGIQTAKIISLISAKVGLRKAIIPRVTGFPKSFYAPLAIKTAHLPVHKKVWHHVRHTRPAWYHKYHSYQIVHYIHYGVLLVATSMIGYHVYSTMALETRAQTAVTAIPATAPPRTLAFQGKLNDASNTPITAETNLRFAIYNSPVGTGSAKLWYEPQTVKPDAEGVFRVTLGTKTPLPQHIFTNYPSLFLGISVGDDEELKPRQPLANVTNAANASTLQGLKPITDSNAGTRNVILALDSSGNLTFGGNANPVFQATGGEFTLSGQVLTLTTNPGSNGNIQLKPDGTGIVDVVKPFQNTSEYGSSPETLGAVEIADSFAVLATTSGQSAFTIKQNGTGNLISASTGDTAKFSVDFEGNTLIGGTLTLNGNRLTSSTNDFTLLSSPINISFGERASALSIGALHGITTVRNNLQVNGESTFTGKITANGGISVPTGKSITLSGFRVGDIPVINGDMNLASNSGLYWDGQTRRFGVDTRTPGSKFAVGDLETGTGTAVVIDSNGNFFRNSSSRRYKDDINPLQTNALVLLNAAPVSFKYSGTTMYDIGYIAEDFDALGLKNLVIYDKNGKPDAIKYDKVSVYILEIVKQQQAAIKALEETAATIKAGYIELQQITSKAVTNVTENITIGGQTVKEYVDEVIAGSIDTTSNTTVNSGTESQLTTPVASGSADTNSQAVTAPASESASFAIASPAASLASNHNSLYTNSATSSAGASASASVAPTSPAAPQASLAGTLTPKSPLFQPGNVMNIKYQAEQTDYANIASYSADLAFVPNFKSDYATFNQGLIALGPSSFTDVGVSGKVSVGDNLHIDNNSINTIASDLNLQPLRQGNLSIMGGLVMIDTEGNLNVNGNAVFAKDVTVKGKLAAGIIAPVPNEDLIISLPEGENGPSSMLVKTATGSAVLSINHKGDLASSGSGRFASVESKTFKVIRGVQADTSLTETVADGSAGTGVITAYERERTIRTPYVNKNSLIYVTATSNTQEVTPYIARQTENSFTVQIPETVAKDISFNWWIVN